MIRLTVSLIAPRCTGMCGALTTRSPFGEKIAQLKSSRSLTFVENDVRCSVIPICSAIEANRLLKISSMTGSAAVALVTRTFRWEGFASVEDVGNHVVGAILMGFGGVTALGCTIGQGLTGISTLAVGSILSLGAIIAGSVMAVKYQMWRIERTEARAAPAPSRSTSGAVAGAPPT